MNEESMTQEKAEKLLDEWGERLGLQDWEIHLAWKCNPEDMPLHNTTGCTNYEEANKEAEIFIIDEQYVEVNPFAFDYEMVLVHELMHLKTSLLTDKNQDGLQYRVMHQLVDDMAKALVKAKRSAS